MRRVLTSVACVLAMVATASVVERVAVADPPPAGTSLVFGAGANNTGQLGNGSTANAVPTPVLNKLPTGLTVTSIAAGYVHSLALTSTGALYAWGDNTYGELGNGTTSTTATTTPGLVSVPAGVTFTAVSVGYYDSLALASDGTVWAWGFNGFGALGTGLAANASVPTQVKLPAGTVATAISAGYAHSLYLTSTGAVYAAGTNNVGQLGTGTTTTSITPVLVHLPAGTTATRIAAGFAHSLAVTSAGGVLAWGYNASGQLGNNSTTQSLSPVAISVPGTVTAVSAGNLDSVALTSAGAVYAWGDNSTGQLGNGTATGTSKVPVAVNLGGASAVSVNAGYGNVVVRTSAGGALAWGLNTNGQDGVGTTTNVLAPTAVKLPPGATVSLVGSSPYSVATLFVISPIATTTTIASSANPATLSQPITYTTTVSPTDGTGTVAFAVDGAALPGCGAVALHLAGSTWLATCTSGPLGAGTHAVTAAYSGTSVYLASSATLSPGQSITSAQGKIVGWGYNGTGQLGNGGTASAALPVAAALPSGVQVVSAVAGSLQSLALTSTGDLYAWGDNQYGELGNGTTTAAGTMNPPTLVNLPAGVRVTAISVGLGDSFALTGDGSIYAWGLNNVGQLGNGSTSNASTPAKVNLPAGVVATSVSGGFAHVLALTSTGAVYAWGWNASGQLGLGVTSPSLATPARVPLPAGVQAGAVAAGFEHSVVMTSAGGAYAWGDDTNSELGNGTTSTTPVASPVAVSLGGTAIASVSAGYFTSSARTTSGGIVAWGLNNTGQLGDGTTTNAPAPVAAILPAGVTVVTEASEFANLVAYTSSGDVYMWGLNNLGQLGNGSATGSTAPSRVHLPPGTTASAIGTSSYASSTFAIVNETDTTTSLTSTAASVAQGNAVTFTATVTPNDGSGTVSFFADGSATALNGCVSLSLTPAASAASVTCSASTLGVGAHTITARYSGTPIYHASSGDLTGGVTVTSTSGAAGGWGLNNTGQLGTGNTVNSRVPIETLLPTGTAVTQVAGGYVHSMALTDTGAVYAWGDDTDGELGDGSSIASTTPVPVNLPSGTQVVAIAVGTASSMALTSTGAVYAWGLNNYGQLGIGGTTSVSTPVLVPLPAGTVVTAISLGNTHALALTSTGAVYAWGRNNSGQLGIGTTTDSSTPVLVHLPVGVAAASIAAGVGHSLIATSTGAVYAWGDNTSGQIGVGVFGGTTSNPTAVPLPSGVLGASVAAGNQTSGVLTTTGNVLTWGANGAGQLGIGSTTNASSPTQVSLPSGTVVSSLVLEWGDGIALTAGGSVYAWGDSSYGQIGNGTFTGSSTPGLVTLPIGGHAVAIAAGAFALDTGIVIPRIATTTTVESGSVTYGAPAVMAASVSPTDGGLVEFFVDGSTTATCDNAILYSSLTPGLKGASCQAYLPVGTHAVTATYLGDGFYEPSTGSLADAETVLKAPSVTTIYDVNADPSPLGAPLKIEAHVAGVGQAAVAFDAGGTITFFYDSTPIPECQGLSLMLVNQTGISTCTTTSIPRGTHSLSATYSGDDSFLGSSGTWGSQLTIQVSTTLTASDVHVLASLGGFKIRFQATLTETISGVPIAGQNVTFTSALLGLTSKCTATTDANGMASCQATIPSLLTGTYDVTFAGTALYLPSSGHARVVL